MGVGVGRFYFAKTGAPVYGRAQPPDPPPYPPPQGGRVILVLPTYGLRDYGRPHGHGLNALGLDPRRLILAETAHRKDTLWAMEEALHSRAVAAVAGFVDQIDLKTSQRLQLAATDCGLPLFLLRPAEMLEASAAATRWRVGAAPAARDRFGLITHARWRLTLERCRNGRTGEWMVEYDHVAHRFSLAAALADPAISRSTGETDEREPSFRRVG
jgi:protein ImuA